MRIISKLVQGTPQSKRDQLSGVWPVVSLSRDVKKYPMPSSGTVIKSFNMNMDFRICIIFFSVLFSYSEQCEVTFDEVECYYNVVCMAEFNEAIDRFVGSRPGCVTKYNYNGHSFYEVHLDYRDISTERFSPFKIVPNNKNDYYNRDVSQVVYSLDLSRNEYKHTPIIKSMNNLEILDLSKNKLTEAVLSNINDLSKLRELDLSDNVIYKIVTNENPYITLEKINISQNYLQKIPDAVFEKFYRLQTLDLSHNYIEDLNQFTFEGVKNLLHLNLSYNRLTGTGSSLFRFSKLRVLNLSGNKITNVKLSDFENLKALEVLDLSSNLIDSIDFNVFSDMALLQSLNLNNNVLSVLNKHMFVNLGSLTSIDLSRNKIKYLGRGLFANKTIYTFSISDNVLEGSIVKGMFEGINVTTLDLSNQLLTELEDYAFRDLIRLDTLLLNKNEIESLSNLCFKTLINLNHLDLSYNQIVNIDFNKDDLTNLQSLILASNLITQIKVEHFQRLVSLEYLDLSGNGITRLEPGSFRALNNLMNLGVSGNPLSGTLEMNTWDGLTALPSLDISFSSLIIIQNASFNTMHDLKDLNMSHSKIKELQYNAFTNTGYIDTLDLSHNHLEDFFINMTDLVGLSSLLLNNNLLKSIHTSSLYDLSRLLKINLAYNIIEKINHETFSSLTNLRDLDLSYNEKLKYSDSLLENVKHVDILNLSGVKSNVSFSEFNNTELSEILMIDAGIHNISLLKLRTLKNLNTLILSSNNVSRIEVGAFSGLDRLRNLVLSFNQISYIQPGVFKDNIDLMLLNISHNCLSEIGYGIFRGLNYLSTLDISYNNIKDLKSERFYEVKSLSTLIVDFNKIDSVSAEEFIGTRLSMLSIGDNPLPCHVLVKLIKPEISFEVTAIKLDEQNSENINGITCNMNFEKDIFKTSTPYTFDGKNDLLLEIKNILYNISNKESVHVIDDNKYLKNITNAIEKSSANNEVILSNIANITSQVIDLNNATNKLLVKILDSLKKNTNVATTSKPVYETPIDNNNTAFVIAYVNKMRKEFENSLLIEKQNIINELESKFSLVHYQTESTNSLPSTPRNEKLVAHNETVTKSFFTETCVALILIILVGLVLYKFYKSRMFIRNRLSISTRELPGAMENSTL